MFHELGVPIIDTDIISREIIAPGTSGYEQLIQKFSSSILSPDSSIDRTKMRELVFTDDYARQCLEEITHPLIYAEVSRQIQATSAPYCLVSIPLLFETGGFELLDRVIAVECKREEQLNRLKNRDDISQELAHAMINSQASNQQRREIADDIIDNNKDLKHLQKQVISLHNKYLDIAQL